MSAAKILKYKVRSIPRKLSSSMGAGGGPKGRMMLLRTNVTSLFRHERMEFSALPKADETRGYAERLIQEAVKNGPRDVETMKNADFWLTEKDLIPKLFEVFVPRYQNYDCNYTSIYRLPIKYPGHGRETRCVLELKGNPWPPVIPKPKDFRNTLPNILLHELKKEYRQEKAREFHARADHEHYSGMDNVVSNAEMDNVVSNAEMDNVVSNAEMDNGSGSAEKDNVLPNRDSQISESDREK